MLKHRYKMTEDWVIVKDPMVCYYYTPPITPRSADSGPGWTLDVALLIDRLQALCESNKIELQSNWLWTRVVSTFWDSDSCEDMDKLDALRL